MHKSFSLSLLIAPPRITPPCTLSLSTTFLSFLPSLSFQYFSNPCLTCSPIYLQPSLTHSLSLSISDVKLSDSITSRLERWLLKKDSESCVSPVQISISPTYISISISISPLKKTHISARDREQR